MIINGSVKKILSEEDSILPLLCLSSTIYGTALDVCKDFPMKDDILKQFIEINNCRTIFIFQKLNIPVFKILINNYIKYQPACHNVILNVRPCSTRFYHGKNKKYLTGSAKCIQYSMHCKKKAIKYLLSFDSKQWSNRRNILSRN